MLWNTSIRRNRPVLSMIHLHIFYPFAMSKAQLKQRKQVHGLFAFELNARE